MRILRIKSFSKKEKKEENIKSTKKDAIIGGGLVAGGFAGNDATGEDVLSKMDRSKFSKENARINKELLEEAEKKGVKIKKHLPPSNTGIKKLDEILDTLMNASPAYGPDNDTVYTQGHEDAATLSHELGHRHYTKERAGKIGKGSHKAYFAMGGGNLHTIVAPTSGFVAGKIAGKNKARREERGEKESKVNKAAPIVTPILVSAPGLVAEAAASRHGIKSLKRHGASKGLIKESKKKLATAFGTYATLGAMNSGIGELSKHRAYKKEKKKIEREKNQRKNENTKN